MNKYNYEKDVNTILTIHNKYCNGIKNPIGLNKFTRSCIEYGIIIANPVMMNINKNYDKLEKEEKLYIIEHLIDIIRFFNSFCEAYPIFCRSTYSNHMFHDYSQQKINIKIFLDKFPIYHNRKDFILFYEFYKTSNLNNIDLISRNNTILNYLTDFYSCREIASYL